MVVFTCGNCGESVKKPVVEKHYNTRCRGQPNLTCIDCVKDFKGDEYIAHVKCLTEEERYSAKGFVSKQSSNKGEKKQQSWFEAVHNVLNSDRELNHDERELLTVLSNHENIPRKKGKFMNFLQNAHRAYARRGDLVERVWNIVEEVGKAAVAPAAPVEGNTENSEKPHVENGEEVDIKKSKKNKAEMSKPTQQTYELNNETEACAKKSKKRKNCEKELNGGSDPSKKKKKSEEISEITEQRQNEHVPETSDTSESDQGLREILQLTGISIYKLNKAIDKYCSSIIGGENPKARKKIEKKIVITSLTSL